MRSRAEERNPKRFEEQDHVEGEAALKGRVLA